MTLLQRLADRAWAAALAFVPPWSSRSQHDSYLRGLQGRAQGREDAAGSAGAGAMSETGFFRTYEVPSDMARLILDGLANGDCHCEPGDPSCQDWTDREARLHSQMRGIVRLLGADDARDPVVWPDRPDIYWCVGCNAYHRDDYRHDWTPPPAGEARSHP